MRVLPFLFTLLATRAWSSVLADSINDFSSVQGQKGWTYRYYDKTHDFTPTAYNYLTESPLMTQYRTTNSFSTAGIGPAWCVADGTYWTLLGKDSSHGNGLVTSGGRTKDEQFSVRRWTSTYSGMANITGTVAKYKSADSVTNTTGGNGVQMYLVINGVFTKAIYIGAANQTGSSFSYTAYVHVGDAIEWWLDPYQADDRADLSYMHGQVTTVPEPPALVFMAGSIGLMIRAGKRFRRS